MQPLYSRRRRRSVAASPIAFRYTPGNSLAGATTSRATTATYFDVNGIVQTASSGVMRDGHYISSTRTLLLESQRTNIVMWCRDLTNAAWVHRGTCAVAKTATGADGVANSATAITGLGAVGVNDVYNLGGTVTTSTRCEPSLMLQKVTSAGTVQIVNAQNTSNGTWNVNLSLLGSGYEYITRFHPAVTIVTEFTGVGNLAGFLLGCSAGSPVAINVDFTVLEVGAFSESPIATTTAVITRNVDAVSFPGVTTGTATLFYRYYNLATAAFVDSVAAYTSGTTITPPVDRAYQVIAVLNGTLTAPQAALLLGVP